MFVNSGIRFFKEKSIEVKENSRFEEVSHQDMDQK